MKKAGLEKNIVLDLPFDFNLKNFTPVVLRLRAALDGYHKMPDAAFSEALASFCAEKSPPLSHIPYWKDELCHG